MTFLDFVVTLLVAAVSGGLVATIVNAVHVTRSKRQQREIEYLEQQLQSLYGPLYFFTSQNERLFRLYNDIHNAYSHHFGGKWSGDARTQDTLTKEADATIDLGNEYVKRVVANNEAVMRLLERNWHLADTDHLDIFSNFQVDFTRFQVEVEEGRRKEVPWGVTSALDNISYMKPEMIEAVRGAVTSKQSRLRSLRPVEAPSPKPGIIARMKRFLPGSDR
jgi:hypothetical protein